MTLEEARQLMGVERVISAEDLHELFSRRFGEMESKLERAPTPSLKEKYRRGLSQLEEAWEVLSDGSSQQTSANFPSLHPIIEERSPSEVQRQIPVQEQSISPKAKKSLGRLIALTYLSLPIGYLVWYFGIPLVVNIKAALLANSETETAKQTDNSFINSLGMVFVPAGTDGVLSSIWDVRVKDYAVYVQQMGIDWPKPQFRQTNYDPVVYVSWTDAHEFCDWLTQKERREGKLRDNQIYRLPTSAEWCTAAGNGNVLVGRQLACARKLCQLRQQHFARWGLCRQQTDFTIWQAT